MEEETQQKQPLLSSFVNDDNDDDDERCDEGSLYDAACLAPNGYGSINRETSDSQLAYQENQCEEKQPPRREDETHVYKRRWYILTAYSIIACTQGAVWNTWGPISSTTLDALGWSDGTTALMENWGPITFILTGLLFSWMLDVKGLRWACVSTAVLVALGTAVRCITMETVAFTWLTHVGQFLNGCGGLVGMAGAPIVSAVWFPANERATATATGISLNYIGVAIAYILGPLIVPDVPNNNNNNNNTSITTPKPETRFTNTFPSQNIQEYLYSVRNFTTSNDATQNHTDQVNSEKNAIRLYMFYEAGWSVLILLLLLVYFPKKPPKPPCVSAAIKREDFLPGLKRLLTRGQFWLMSMVYGVSLGALNGWSSVLDTMLKPFNIGQVEAGWIGFYSIIAACAVSIIVARFADYVSRIMKWLIIFCYFIATGCFLVFSLITVNVVPASTALFYITIIGGTTALNAAVPLMYELCSEMAYPTGEGTTNGVLSMLNNFVSLIYLVLMMIPSIGSMWTNWTMVASSGVCIPLLFLMKESYNRLELDEHKPSLNAEIIVDEPSSNSDVRHTV